MSKVSRRNDVPAFASGLNGGLTGQSNCEKIVGAMEVSREATRTMQLGRQNQEDFETRNSLLNFKRSNG